MPALSSQRPARKYASVQPRARRRPSTTCTRPYIDRRGLPDLSRRLPEGARFCPNATAQNSATTVDALALEARGTVPHWPEERRHPTLHELLIRMVGETNRHAGHADIVRESIDGAAGMRPAMTNLPDEGDEWWATYRDKLEEVASRFKP
jgi:hypothetical protein